MKNIVFCCGHCNGHIVFVFRKLHIVLVAVIEKLAYLALSVFLSDINVIYVSCHVKFHYYLQCLIALM